MLYLIFFVKNKVVCWKNIKIILSKENLVKRRIKLKNKMIELVDKIISLENDNYNNKLEFERIEKEIQIIENS